MKYKHTVDMIKAKFIQNYLKASEGQEIPKISGFL